MSYYNTTNLSGKDLIIATNKANTQKEKVFAFFKLFPEQTFTPAEVHMQIFDESVPLTSTRRAMTDLTKLGLLMQTSEKREGVFGTPNYCWKLAPVGRA